MKPWKAVALASPENERKVNCGRVMTPPPWLMAAAGGEPAPSGLAPLLAEDAAGQVSMLPLMADVADAKLLEEPAADADDDDKPAADDAWDVPDAEDETCIPPEAEDEADDAVEEVPIVVDVAAALEPDTPSLDD